MSQTPSTQPLRRLVDRFRAGDLSRRDFVQRATALGVGLAAANVIASEVAAQSATPSDAASPVASPVAGFPDDGTEGQTRGAGGELRIIQSQAPSVLSTHRSTGSKDVYAASLVLEPLLTYFADGSLGPQLLASVPSVEDGTLSEDLTQVTLTLKEGLLWNDGEPVTSNDIVFTWKWVTTAENSSSNIELWGLIETIETTDDLTAVVTFSSPQVAWFEPFTSAEYGVLLPAHAFNDDPTFVNDDFLINPIGTGPYKVDSFSPNDLVLYSINEHYREPNKPFFATVTFKGGGDAVSAGRAVAQTGEYDFAWNVQAEPTIIADIVNNATTGTIVQSIGTTVEALYVNFSDPYTEVNGQRSEKNTPNPVLSDLAVRRAIALGIQRDVISDEFYGAAENATANILDGNPSFTSPNTTWAYDPEQAATILDEAGWVLDGDVRTKDGVELHILYSAPINSVRQKTQAVIKQNLGNIGFNVELTEVDSNIFFDSSAGNDQNNQHFYWDVAVWSSGPNSAIPVKFVAKWYAGPDGENIAQQENGWSKPNVQRWNDPNFDALYEQLLTVKTQAEASEVLIEINDYVIDQGAVVPIVLRPFYDAVSNRLNFASLGHENGFATPYWNIANWNLATE